MALTSQERAAQRSLVGLIRVGSAILDSAIGLRIWRARGSEEWQVGVDEISDHFETLGIPYHVALMRRTIRRRAVVGFEIRIDWDDLPTVLRWAPSLQKLIDAVAEPPEQVAAVVAAEPPEGLRHPPAGSVRA